MSGINDPQNTDAVIHDPEELRRRSPLFFIVAVLIGLALTAGLLGGYFYLRSRHAAETLAQQQQQQQQAAPAKPVAPPELKIFEDQAMIKGRQVVIAGTAQNISNAPLADLSVELELIRRSDNSTETRSLPLVPKDLAQNEQGRYSLTVLSRDWKKARVLRVRSGSRSNDVAFTTAPGAQRPPGPPQQTPKTIIVNRPKTGNDGFINTPDNPVKVP